MKPLIKYPVTLFILLLIGYSQLFAPLSMAGLPNTPRISQSQHQAYFIKTTEKEDIYIEEEDEKDDEWNLFRKHTECNSTLFNFHLQASFSRHIKCASPFIEHCCLFFLNSPYLVFRVIRL